MQLSDVPGSLILQFERGYIPLDEPPGLEELAYAAWKAAGGKVKEPAAAPEFVQPSATWGILELMGHIRLAGRISEEEKFGAKMGRIDVPLKDGTFATQYFGASSVYRLSLVSEEVARSVALNLIQPVPVSSWELPKQLAAAPSQHSADSNEADRVYRDTHDDEAGAPARVPPDAIYRTDEDDLDEDDLDEGEWDRGHDF